MSIPAIKSLTKRIRKRHGSSEAAAVAAGLSNKGAWSLYESENHPETTLPLHRFLMVANAEERALFARLMADEDDGPEDLMTAASETTEASADMQRAVREATADGVVTPLERSSIRAAAMKVMAVADDVLRGVS